MAMEQPSFKTEVSINNIKQEIRCFSRCHYCVK